MSFLTVSPEGASSKTLVTCIILFNSEEHLHGFKMELFCGLWDKAQRAQAVRGQKSLNSRDAAAAGASATEGRPGYLRRTAALNFLSDCIRSPSCHPTLCLVSVSVLHKACVALM